MVGFGIAHLLSTPICTLTQNQLAQVYVDTQGWRICKVEAIGLPLVLKLARYEALSPLPLTHRLKLINDYKVNITNPY